MEDHWAETRVSSMYTMDEWKVGIWVWICLLTSGFSSPLYRKPAKACEQYAKEHFNGKI